MKMNLYNWMHDDITWCGSDCDNVSCFRHPSNMMIKDGIHSFSCFKETGECPVSKEQITNKEGEKDI